MVGEGRVLDGGLVTRHVAGCTVLRAYGTGGAQLTACQRFSGSSWKPFTSSVEEPWVIYSNAAFVGRPETGMRYYNSREDSKSRVYDHYTGVGEVLAIHALDDAFGTLGRRILVKRGSLFTLDDMKNNNLIFVGSPSENLSLLDIPGTQDFVFQRVAVWSAARRSFHRQQTSEAGRSRCLPRQSLELRINRRLFGHRIGAWGRVRPVCHDPRRNNHIRNARRRRICVPPRLSR